MLPPRRSHLFALALALALVLAACSSSSSSSPNDLSGTAECNAYCDKVASLGCGATCDRAFVCKVPDGSCAAATQARLDCKVKTGLWQCQGAGYSVGYSCKDYLELCGAGGDGGIDTGSAADATGD